MRRFLLFVLLVLFTLAGHSATRPSYRGLIRIPVELYTTDGTRLEKGQYEMEVKAPNDQFMLTFLSKGQEKVSVKGTIQEKSSDTVSANLPLVGTHFLRSSADPLATAQERQHSKTGRAQYEEEERDWKGTMRVYRSAEGPAVYFVFQERLEGTDWQTVVFDLSLTGAAK